MSLKLLRLNDKLPQQVNSCCVDFSWTNFKMKRYTEKSCSTGMNTLKYWILRIRRKKNRLLNAFVYQNSFNYKWAEAGKFITVRLCEIILTTSEYIIYDWFCSMLKEVTTIGLYNSLLWHSNVTVRGFSAK